MKECPLLAMTYAICNNINKSVTRGSATQCKKEKCEWYDINNKCCNIQHLENIACLIREK